MGAGKQKKTIFAQGMRRSGTTVLFDLMLEDGQFSCFYEPLAAAKQALGGGSGIHSDSDLFDSVRRGRADFLSANPKWLERCPEFEELNLLNYGAPRLPELEFEPDLPDYCKDYIQHLAFCADHTFCKFTRMHSKVSVLKEIAPASKFMHIVRDPRHVVGSYLFGKNGRNRSRFPNADTFFTRTSTRTAWSSYPFSEFIRSIPGYSGLDEWEDFLRVLLIWKYKFERTHALAKKAFGDDYLLFRHEDLVQYPRAMLKRLEGVLEIPLRNKTIDWAERNMRVPAAPYAEDDVRWQRAFERLGMAETLRAAGYSSLRDSR